MGNHYNTSLYVGYVAGQSALDVRYSATTVGTGYKVGEFVPEAVSRVRLSPTLRATRGGWMNGGWEGTR